MSELPLCAVTMLRDDYAFLDKWIAHYRQVVTDPRHLYIVSHGSDTRVPDLARECSVLTIPHFENGSQFEPRRRKMFFGLIGALRSYFQHVIVTDVDEYIVLDPALGLSLPDYLDAKSFQGRVLSPLGFDIVHKPSVEDTPFDFRRPVTAQRAYGYLEAAYTKPCIFRDAPVAGGNAHFINDEPWDIDRNLMLFHMKYFDRTIGLDMAQRRLETVLDYEKHSQTHRIGGWHNRAQKLETTIARLEAAEAADLAATDADRFAADMVAAFQTRGRFPWAISQRGPFRIPERFLGTA